MYIFYLDNFYFQSSVNVEINKNTTITKLTGHSDLNGKILKVN